MGRLKGVSGRDVVEFLRSIFESLPQPANDSWLNFLVERGALIAAIGVLLLYPAEIALRRWSSHWRLSDVQKRRLELFGTFVLMFTLLLVVGLGL
jgi:hypothetical protein